MPRTTVVPRIVGRGPRRLLIPSVLVGALAVTSMFTSTRDNGEAFAATQGSLTTFVASPVMNVSLPASTGVGPALQAGEAAVPIHDGTTFDLDRGWRFTLVNTTGVDDPSSPSADAASPDLDDSAWREVDLPHDWSIELNPTAGADTNAGTGFLQGGLGWYRKTFTLPASLTGQQLSAEFDGVYMDSEIYLNGNLVATHAYGYTGFSVDLTGAYTDGQTPNVLAVKVRNQVPSSRWYSGSGIYRHVRLVATGPVHVQRLGVVVTTPGLEETLPLGYATVHTEVTVKNHGTAPVAAEVRTTVVDVGDVVVAQESSAISLPVAGTTAATNVTVDNPPAWSPDSPYLYSMVVEVVVDEQVVDRYETPFGVRIIRFDPASGFYLNGQLTKLHGVNLHHDQGALGSAINSDALRRQLTTMKDMGVNAVRTSHNPPAPELVQLCDQLGLFLMVEAFDVWNVPKVTYDYARFFEANADADITEMVQESRNSPSVIMWSIGNEIPNSTDASGVPIARQLIADVRAADPTRPIVLGSDRYRSVPDAGSPAEQILQMVDGVGLNYNTATSVDALHARYPTTFFFESESSSETSSRGAYEQPNQLNTGADHTPGDRSASSYDNNLAPWTISGEYSLKKDRDRSWFLGEFLWSGTDYIGEPTPFDVFPVKTSFFGAVDTAGFPKDQFYLFQSQWTSTPMVHLVPTDWTNHEAGEPVQVWVYSNVDSVELFLNGVSLGTRTFDRKTTPEGLSYLETTEATGDDKNVTTGMYPGSYTSPNGSAGHLRLTWDVPFAPGNLVAVARDNGSIAARDEVVTAGAPASLAVTSDRSIVTADGTSLVYATVGVVDAAGHTVPSAENLVNFTVTGGRLAGVDNGRQESAENYTASYRTAYRGKVLAIVSAPTTTGTITITAEADGLPPATVTVNAVDPAPGLAPAPERPAPGNAPTSPVPGIDRSADASFSGSETTQPAAMLDGDPATMWSDAYTMAPTGLLPLVSAAHSQAWVCLTLPQEQAITGLTPAFVVDDQHSLPASVQASWWDGNAWVPVENLSWGGASDSGVLTFDQVTTSRIRLLMSSSRPGLSDGFMAISELGIT